MWPVNIMHRSQGHCEAFTSVQDEIWLANKKKPQKHAAVTGKGPFIVLFSSSALLGVSISESDATWFPFTLVIWLLITNFETKCWVNMPVAQMHTHTNMWHAHTHPCTHPHPYTLTKRLCPCWMFLAASGVETFQSGHMTCAHPSAHRDPQQWLSTLQGVTKGSEGWRKQRERRVKATRGEKNEGNKGREEQRVEETREKNECNKGRVEWRQQGERRVKETSRQKHEGAERADEKNEASFWKRRRYIVHK